MGKTLQKSSPGFTLVEMLIAMTVGLIIIAAAVQLFSKGVTASWTVSQRAQMQQDARAAEDMLIKDISMAGSGIQGGVVLASGTGKNPRYGCDQVNCYVGGGGAPAGIAFPNNYLYPIIPGPGMGPILNAAAGATDIITVTYADSTFLLNCYTVSFNNPNGTSVNFTLPNPLPPNCTPPQVPQNPQPVTSQAVGLQVGDLVLFTGAVGGNTQMAVGEVTTTAGGASPYTVGFADPDRLLVNQTVAPSGDLKSLNGGVNIQATRIWVITYYIWVAPNPSGAGAGTPRLMRQVNGLPPVPVADNISDLRFSYDTFDDNGNLLTRSKDAGLSTGVNPNSIRKVTIEALTFRSPLPGTQGYQSLNLHTSVSARNMSFKDRYN